MIVVSNRIPVAKGTKQSLLHGSGTAQVESSIIPASFG